MVRISGHSGDIDDVSLLVLAEAIQGRADVGSRAEEEGAFVIMQDEERSTGAPAGDFAIDAYAGGEGIAQFR